ncbi:sigma-70 family RNA polymerase sigma factor [Streptomyces katrae]|uniref:RNA polymerase sigma factor 70 region 4 type 2 domain-containing protein n=1 Tax=Streptomyces katrae TaxID=68223 RepID=A0A0F4JB85_9ACTN|nr:sigma-70 family RNA polymerase sigma factor [Streptomyces katrae]KJY31627.1 hypothetical protein VR44_17770 [Streptomyces katrae]
MSDVGTAEHDDPAGATRDTWGRHLSHPASEPVGMPHVIRDGSVPLVPVPPQPEAPDHWTPEQVARFQEYHERYAEKFLWYADARLPSRFDAEDAVHSTFEYVVEQWPRVTTMEFPSAYGWTVLRSRIADLHREGSRIGPVDDERLQEEIGQRPVGDHGEEIVNLMSLLEEIRELPERQEQALVLDALGVPVEEMAELMGIKEESARMNLKRAKARLKRRLDAEGWRRKW